MSKGLFQKAILESEAPVCTWASPAPGMASNRAYSIATIAGCHFNTFESVLGCLRKLPAQNLVDLHLRLFVCYVFIKKKN